MGIRVVAFAVALLAASEVQAQSVRGRRRGGSEYDPPGHTPPLIESADRGGVCRIAGNGRLRLRDIPAADVVAMRYLDRQEATMRYGKEHAGGVIEVATR